VLNIMNMEWVQGLDAAVRAAAAASVVRVVLVRGAGLDLVIYARDGMPPGFYELQERAFRRLELMDKITIAAVHRHCLGGGVQLAIACGIRVCASECRVGLPAIHEGLFPGMAPLRLPQLIGLAPARRLILSGEVIEPDEALRLGLTDHMMPAERFDAGVADVVQRYLAAPATAAIAAKHLISRTLDTAFDTIYRSRASCWPSAWRRRKPRPREQLGASTGRRRARAIKRVARLNELDTRELSDHRLCAGLVAAAADPRSVVESVLA
jgi:enoyl-CoA hydratase